MALTASVRSQDAETAASSRSTPAPVIVPTTARIVGTIPDGTPPPPQAPKPAFVVPAKDILATTTHEQAGRTITIQKINPIALPPPPAPQPASPTAEIDNAAFKQRLADYRATHPPTGMLSMGATVYRSHVSPPRTLVSYWPEHGGESITFWSSVDFALISGIHSIVATDGRTYSLFLVWGNIDTTRTAAFASGMSHPPDIPAFPDGPATFTIVGTPPADPTVLVPIQSLHDLYNSEFNRLKTAWDGRERARIEREVYLKAHPPQPKNITLNYWRTEKPAAVKGAAR